MTEEVTTGALFFVLAASWVATGAGTTEPQTTVAAPPASAEHTAPGEPALLARLRAPCCWTQTLDIHASPVTFALRREIRQRLWEGESPKAIEADLVARYGARIRAVPEGLDPRIAVPVVIGLGMVLSAIGLMAVSRRWAGRARSATPPDPSMTAGARARLRDALSDLD